MRPQLNLNTMKTKGIPVAVAIILLISLPFGSSELSAQRRDNDRPEPQKLEKPSYG